MWWMTQLCVIMYLWSLIPGEVAAVEGRLVGSISESDLRRITPGHFHVLVGRCRFTVSKPLLKAPMVSAISA
jgi:CBS domain-containing protein